MWTLAHHFRNETKSKYLIATRNRNENRHSAIARLVHLLYRRGDFHSHFDMVVHRIRTWMLDMCALSQLLQKNLPTLLSTLLLLSVRHGPQV